MLTVKADAFASEIAIGAQQAQVTSTDLQAGVVAELNSYPLTVRTAVLALAAAITAGVAST
jgi:hypothetical protein